MTTRCRACGGDEVHVFLSLGNHPPANAFVRAEHLGLPEFAPPLDALTCLACGLIQVIDRVPADFYRDYPYTAEASDGLRAHFESLAGVLAEMAGGLVVDVGSNVGLLLDAARSRGLCVVGVDPAENLSAQARARGHRVVGGKFDEAAAQAIRAQHGPASVVVTTNTFNHVDDLGAFCRAVASLLDEDGRFVVEVPHAVDLLEQNQFDTIYQEHLSEFSVRSFDVLFARTGLELVDVVPIPVHGGSLRVIAQRRGGGHARKDSVAAYLELERQRGLFDERTYADFADRVRANGERLRAMIGAIRRDGGVVAAYGAPAKGNTLLIHYGLGAESIAFVADRNPRKQGRFTPLSHIPVVPVEEILRSQPDCLLLLAWNHAPEVFAQQAEYLRRGGRILIPIPEPRSYAFGDFAP